MSRYNHRKAKTRRNYTVDEIADVFGVHKGTVRNWIKCGLQVMDKKRPTLIMGLELRRFLEKKRTKNKRKCKPGEIFCVKCREPRLPANMKVNYKPLSDTQGFLIGLCQVCEISIYRRVSLDKINIASGDLVITMPEELRHIVRGDNPSLNRDLNK